MWRNIQTSNSYTNCLTLYCSTLHATGTNRTRTSGFRYIPQPLKSLSTSTCCPGTISRSKFHRIFEMKSLLCRQAISLPAQMRGPWLKGWNPLRLSSANRESYRGWSPGSHLSGRKRKGSRKLRRLRASAKLLDWQTT